MTKPILKALAVLLVAMASVSSGFIAGNMMQGPMTWVTTRTQTDRVLITETVRLTVTHVATPTGPVGGWREIKRFTGSVEMTTEPFYVPTTMWRISWSYSSDKEAVFAFFAFPLGETSLYVESVSSYKPTASGTTHIYKGPGNFYLKIVTTAAYTILIEAPN